MDRTERFYRIDRLLQDRRLVPVQVFLEELGISLATFKRDLAYLRDRLNAPITWDREAGGYRFEQQGVGDKYELPGLWFSASEIHALLTMQQLLGSLGTGLLTPHIKPLMSRLRGLLDQEGIPVEAVEARIRIQRSAARGYEPACFTPLATAVLQRHQVKIQHYNRERNETTERVISPQRLNYYRENWYVDAWCHLRHGLRSFALDAIASVSPQAEAAKEMTPEAMANELDQGYGIFSGKTVQWARLQFTPERARWVSKEIWHPDQRGAWLADGRYVLEVPYSSDKELLMDIQRHLPEVQVLAPEVLKSQLLSTLHEAIAQQQKV